MPTHLHYPPLTQRMNDPHPNKWHTTPRAIDALYMMLMVPMSPLLLLTLRTNVLVMGPPRLTRCTMMMLYSIPALMMTTMAPLVLRLTPLPTLSRTIGPLAQK